MRRSRRWRKRAWLAVFALCVSAFLYGFFLYTTLSLPRGEDRQPLRIYSNAYPLSPGLDIQKAHIPDRLNHLGYRQVSRKLQAPGEYRKGESTLDLYLREFQYPEGLVRARPIRLVVEEGRIAKILQLPEEKEVGPVALEPRLIGGLLAESRQVREWIPLSSIPTRLVDVVLAIEDHRFYQHIGIDPLAVIRAGIENLKHGSVQQGGSTITQQLAKNLYYTHQRTFLRKLKEALAALILEMKYTKEEILESYLNEIYLGQSGSMAVYGVGEAAHHYFGKSVKDLTVEECALLAGMIKGPNTYAPDKDRQRAKKRRDLVLHRLKEDGKLTEKQYQAAVRAPVRTAPLGKGGGDAPYFVDYVLAQFDDPGQEGFPSGLRIFTTLDPEIQRLAEEAVSRGLARLESRYPLLVSRESRLEAALVAIDPKTGGILAMVGGRDYRTGQFNHAVQARRQAGSLFKPFVYLAAFQRSLESKDNAITPATLLKDAPVTFSHGNTAWSPQNYDRQFHGDVTVRTALEQSLNVPAVRVAQTVGVQPIIRLLRDLGIRGPLEDNLSLALGTSEVSLLEITGAFGALAREGRFVPPTGLKTVAEPAQVFSPQAAYLVTSSLKGVVERGTAAQASSMGLTTVVAGKTGTTDDHRDAWFVGYTPDVVIGVWVGFDDGATLRLTGAQAALPIWVDFFQKAIPTDSTHLPIPAGIVSRIIDPFTAQLATSDCPYAVEESFIEGTEPTIFCEVHSPGFVERVKRMFGL